MAGIKNHAITKDTSKNMAFGAGIVVKDLKYSVSEWTYKELGATNGGSKVAYEREFVDLEVDGKTVKVEGFVVKVAESAKMTINLAEYKIDTLKVALSLVEDTGAEKVTGYSTYKPSKTNQYLENLAFVGKTVEGKDVIVKFPKAICLSAFELEGKNKEQSTMALEFEAVAPTTSSNFEELGVQFIFPTPVV